MNVQYLNLIDERSRFSFDFEKGQLSNLGLMGYYLFYLNILGSVNGFIHPNFTVFYINKILRGI